MAVAIAPGVTFPEIPFLDEGDFAYVGRGLYAGVIRVTPEMAARWLGQRNPENRRITGSTVAAYARVMAEGLWAMNGEPLIFDREGNGKDFQHRLSACVKSETDFWTLVIVGVEPSVMNTINTGQTRSVGAVLGIGGENNSYAVAGMARWIYLYKHGLSFHEKVTAPQSEEILAAHPHLRDFTTRRFRDIRHFPHGLYGGLSYMFWLVDAELEEDMFVRLREGTGLVKGDPVHTLRTTALRNASSSSRLPVKTWFAYIVKTWNASVAGREMKLLRWTDAEELPRISGLRREDL